MPEVTIHWTGSSWLAADRASRLEIGAEAETLDKCIRAAHADGHVVTSVHCTLGNVVRKKAEPPAESA